MAALSAGGGEEGLFGRDGSGATAVAGEAEVSALLKGAMAAAQALLRANAALLERLGATLEEEERMGGDRLAAFLADVKAALPLTQFVSGA